MRRVDPPRRPRGWQTHVFQRGRRWLREWPGDNRCAERPADLWRRPYFRDPSRSWLDVIGESFRYLCCYTATYVPNGQVDHFVPWQAIRGTRRAELAYEWSNIRYSDGWINQSKGGDAFPDPFEVRDEWFELHLPSLELRATASVPDEQRVAVENIMRRIGRDERVMKTRRRYFGLYRRGECSLRFLDEQIPLLARALRRHPQYLTEADRGRQPTDAP